MLPTVVIVIITYIYKSEKEKNKTFKIQENRLLE